jgi:hypothetical protein
VVLKHFNFPLPNAQLLLPTYLPENVGILQHPSISLYFYPILHLNWYISDHYISHSSPTITSDDYIPRRILLLQYSHVFTILIRRFVFTLSRIEITRNRISSNYAGKPIIFDHFYLTAGKRIMQLFRTREIGDSEEIKVKLNHLFII